MWCVSVLWEEGDAPQGRRNWAGKMASEEQDPGREPPVEFGGGNYLSRPRFLGSGRGTLDKPVNLGVGYMTSYHLHFHLFPIPEASVQRWPGMVSAHSVLRAAAIPPAAQLPAAGTQNPAFFCAAQAIWKGLHLVIPDGPQSPVPEETLIPGTSLAWAARGGVGGGGQRCDCQRLFHK